MSYNYVSAATYWPDGAPKTMTIGNGLTTTWYRNKRMQPKETVLANGNTQFIDRQYCYGASAVSGANCTSQSVGDNGNINQIQDVLNGNNTQTFQYDNLNRLNSFTNGGGNMQQTYAIDPWGNLIQSGTLSSGTTFLGATTNRDTSGNTQYDDAGNTIHYYSGGITHSAAYDDDGQITSVDSGYASYTYDAPGNRIRKDSAGSWTEYIYFGSQVLAEKNSDGTWSDYIFANGTRLAKASSVNALIPSSSTTYYHSDQIGSTRMLSDGSGAPSPSTEYYPYGQGPQPTSQNHYLFSGKERDAESGGLDYFGARYYLSGIGRFMSADWSAQADPVPYAKLDDPQTLNLFAYVRNNPISIVDPDGHYGNPNIYNYFYDPVACDLNEQIETKNKRDNQEAHRQAQQQNKIQKWEVQNEKKVKALIASYPKAPAGARMVLTDCTAKLCNYTLTGVSGTFYAYEHFANSGVSPAIPVGPGDYTTDKSGTAGGFKDDQITAMGLGGLDQHRFFTISSSSVYNPNNQMFVIINDAGQDYAYEHLYDEAANAPSYINGISTDSYHR